jgi:plasmid stabilization system protein ParE
MSKTYFLTPKAEADLWSIIDYITKDSPDSALKVFDELIKALETLAEMPGLGHRREDVTARPLRFWSVYSFLIVYWPETDPLKIIRIVHGARELQAILDQ